MICEYCETEYPEGITMCAACGYELVDELPAPPSEHALEPLCDLRDRLQLELLVERLEDAAIPYSVHSGTALSMQDHAILSDTIHRGVWEARVMVVGSRHEEARAEWLAAVADAEAAGGEEGGSEDLAPDDEGSRWDYAKTRVTPK